LKQRARFADQDEQIVDTWPEDALALLMEEHEVCGLDSRRSTVRLPFGGALTQSLRAALWSRLRRRRGS
jgi:hypothetical protein